MENERPPYVFISRAVLLNTVINSGGTTGCRALTTFVPHYHYPSPAVYTPVTYSFILFSEEFGDNTRSDGGLVKFKVNVQSLKKFIFNKIRSKF